MLIPLDAALPAIRAYLDARRGRPLDPGEVLVAADLLERCVRTGRVLVAFALQVGGRPAAN